MKSFRQKITVALLTALLITNLSIAQETENANANAGDDPDIPNIPLDGGLSILLVAGAAYGGKKLHNYRKGKNNPENKDSV